MDRTAENIQGDVDAVSWPRAVALCSFKLVWGAGVDEHSEKFIVCQNIQGVPIDGGYMHRLIKR